MNLVFICFFSCVVVALSGWSKIRVIFTLHRPWLLRCAFLAMRCDALVTTIHPSMVALRRSLALSTVTVRGTTSSRRTGNRNENPDSTAIKTATETEATVDKCRSKSQFMRVRSGITLLPFLPHMPVGGLEGRKVASSSRQFKVPVPGQQQQQQQQQRKRGESEKLLTQQEHI